MKTTQNRTLNRRSNKQKRRSFLQTSSTQRSPWRSRTLRVESLEERRVLATLYVDNPGDFAITTDQGAPGLDAGDTVTWNPGAGSAHGAAVPGLIFGTGAFSTIQTAVNAAVDGVDVIRVAPGTFAELVTVNKTLDVFGNQTGVDARNRAAVPETIVNGNAGTTAFIVDDDDVELNGFTVRDQTQVNQFGAGVFLRPGTAGTEFRNNIVEFNVIGLFLANDDGGNQTVIERNVFRQNNNPGAGSGNGIYLDQFTAGGAVNNVLITNNSFENNNSAGINFSSTDPASPTNNATISQNTFNNNGNAISAFNTTNSTITQNLIEDSNGSQIRLRGGNNNVSITQNFIEDGDARGIHVQNLIGVPNQNISINNNSIENNVGAGLELDANAYTGTLNAENNWWGAPTGPTSPVNPGGTGQSLVDPNLQVDFSPFLAAGVDTLPGTPGFQGNLVAPLGIAVVGTPDDDIVVVTATSENDGTYQVTTNGIAGPVVPFADITSFSSALLGDTDTLIIVNPATGVFAPSLGIFYDGGGQPGDALSNRGGTATSGSYTPGPTNDAGIITHVGPFTQTISFTGLAPADDTVAEANFTINGTAAGNAISITNGPVVALVQTVNVAIDAFEPLNFGNKTNVDINALGGGDTITTNFTINAAGLVTLDEFGHNDTGVGDDNSSDIFNLLAFPAAVSLLASGQGGTDYFNNLATLNLDPLAGPLTINGGETAADGDVARLQDSADPGPDTVTFDRTSPTVGTIAGAAAGLITYTNLEVMFFEGSAGADTINVLATLAGTNYYVTGNGGGDTVTIGNQTADFNSTFDGSLDNILGDILVAGEFNPAGPGAIDTLNVDDSGTAAPNVASISINPTFDFTLPAPAPGGTDSGPATELTGFAPAVIRYRHNNSTFLPPANNNRMEFVNVLSGSGADTITVNATTATNTTSINAREGNDTVNITGDNLSANNLISGFDGTDTFNLTISAHIGASAFAPVTGLTISGNDPAATSESRDRLNINDNNAGFARNLNFDHLDTAGDLDILPGVAGAGYAGPINAGLAVNVRSMETIVTTSTTDNDTVRVTGTSADDNLTAVPRSSGQALVFLNGNPYLNTPPDSLATFLPGLAGGGRGPDLSLDGIAGNLTLDGGAVSGEGNRAIVQGVSENNITTGGTLDIFGFGAGVLIPGGGVGNAYDTINVTDALVTINNIAQGPLTPVALVTASFNQTSPDTPFQRAGLIVNGGDEAVAQANGIADNITAFISAVFNIQVNGNLPTLVLGPDGLPRGDQLNITGPGDINIFSDKATPPNVTVTFSDNPGPFGIRHSSIERLILDAGTPPASGGVNLIGDNNDPAVDQNDNFVVRGRDIDGNLLDAGYQEMTVSINGSAPILINGVQRLSVYGDDQNPPPGTPSVGPNDIDTLDIRAYADNAANPPNNAPRGWGVDVFFNEGNPVGADGNQADLLIYHTSAGLGGGGSVSENVVVQPSGPDSGEVRANNATDGSVIVTIQYVANTDIVVLDDDGATADTDTLTLNGTNPDGTLTSGRETFAANFAAAGDLANPLVTVTDTASAAILYRLRNFTGFNSITLNPLGGGDTINLINRAGLTVNANGGSPLAIGAQNDALNMTVTNGARYTQGAVSTEGRIDNTGVGDVNFTGFENLGLISTATGGATFNARGTDDNDTIALDRLGTNDLIWINDGPVISFTNFSTVTLDGRFGSDSFSITPDAVAVTAINVNGGDPTASDTAVVNGTVGADAIEYSPIGADSGTVQVNAAPVVNLATVEHLTINGLGGNDALTVNVLAAPNVTQYTPGPVLDSGSVVSGSTLPLDFQNLGSAGTVTLDNAGGRVGALVYNGTNASDIFAVDAAGTITLSTTIGAMTVPRSLPVLTPGIAAATLKGLDGDDSFNIVGNHPFVGGLTVDGGNPTAGDTLNFTGSGGAITVDFAASTITETGFTPVSFSGIATVNVNAAGADFTVLGTPNDDQFVVTPDATQATTRLVFNNTTVNVTSVDAFVVDGVSGDDRLTVNATVNPNTVDVTGTFVDITVPDRQRVDYLNVDELHVLGSSGPDVFNVTPSAATSMFIDGGLPAAGAPGVPSDLLNVLVPASTTITQGADATTGQINAGGASVNFAAVEAVSLTSGDGGTLTVNATDDNDTISVDNLGPEGGADLVWVNDGPVIIVNGFSTLTLNGRFGSDDFSISPAGFGVTEIIVNGGDPTASDTVVVNGTTAGETIVFTPTAADAGTVLVGVAPIVTLATVEHLTINGLGGNDTLTTVTPAAVSSDVTITPGTTPDSGTIQVNSLLPMAFTTLGVTGQLSISDPTVGDRDRVIYNGTAADNLFRVPAGSIAGQSFEMVGQIGVGTSSIESYVLRGLGGADTFDVTAQTGIVIDVQGGDPANSDVLNFTSTGATILRTGASQIDDAGRAGSPDVVYSGIETINIDAAGNTLAVEGSANDDDLTVTPLSDTAGKVELGLAVQQNGQVAQNVAKPLINYSNITGPLAVDLLGGEDTLVVVGNALAQAISVDVPGSTVTIVDLPDDATSDGTVTFANTESLSVFGLEGSDAFTVTPGAIPVFIDGGDPIGVLPGDSLTVLGAIGFFAGPESDEGGFLTDDATVSFDHIESLVVGPIGDDCPFLILGTNADDDITVIARNEITINATTFFLGADGIQDFTVSVNAGPDILFLDEPDLFIDGRNGDDDIVVRTPAPNDAPWNVNVRVAGGPPSIGEPNEADRLVLETPGTDNVEFRPTGPDSGSLVINEGPTENFQLGEGDSIITFGSFVFECTDGEEVIFTYLSSPGGVELVEYDGEDANANPDPADVTNPNDVLTLFAPASAGGSFDTDGTTTVSPQGVGTGTYVSGFSPLFHFRSFEALIVNGGDAGFDHVIINATQGPDTLTSDADTITLADPNLDHFVTLGTSIDQLNLNTFGGNDNVDLDLQLVGLAKTIDVGAGNDTVDLSGVIVDPADPTIFGGLGDDNIIGSPNADLIYGDDGNDTINGLGSNDVVHAGRGNDVLLGGAGADILFGEEGNDRFGDPVIPDPTANDAGNDQFHGGDGSDTFVWDPGDGSDLIEGGDGIGDVLIFNGGAGVDNFTLTASATRLLANRTQGAILLDTADVEVVNLNGLGGADTFTINDLYPTAAQVVNVAFGAADGAVDAVTIAGRDVSDNVNITPVAGIVEVSGLRYDVNVANATAGDGDLFTFNGNNGNDTIVSPLDASLVPHFAVGNFTLSGGLGDDFVTGYGNLLGNEGNDTLVGGNQGQLINGGDGDDQIFGGGGGDTLLGEAGEDTFVPGFDGATDTIDGGADFDTILVQGNSANNRIDARQGAIDQVSYEISGINGGDGVIGGAGTETDTIVAGTVEQLTILAGSGDDLIRVSHNDSLIADEDEAFSLRFTVDGGAPGASDRLTVTDEGLGDTTIHRVGGIAGNGSYAVGALAPVVYTDIEFASLNPINPVTGGTGGDGLGALFVFKHDPFEENNSRLNATFLGSGSAINVDPTIDPGADALFGLPGDEDWYRIIPQFNGDLDIRVFFRQQATLTNGRAGLPGDGNLDIALYDADGLPVEIAGTGAFGTNDANDDERIRIPAVAGQTYYLRVKGAALANLNSPALNIYNLSVINTPAATPIALELDDVVGVATVDAAPAPSATQFDATATAPFVLSTVNDFYNGKDIAFTSGNLNGIKGRVLDYIGATQTFIFAAGTFFAAPSAGSTFQIESADTGRSQFDNITRDTTPTIFLRVPNVVNVGGVANLDDVPFNGGAPGAPPDEFIGIPFNASLTLDATGPGFRVPIFITEHGTSDQGPPNNVLAGYAQPVDPVNRPGLFTFTFGSAGSLIAELPVFPGTSETTSFFLSARVEMIDPAQPQQAQGYGDYAQSLEIVVDTQPPPVFFGLPNVPGDGLLPGSDTGLNTNPETLNDGVTSDTTPGFFGQAEADAVIRLFVDAPEPGFPTGDGIFEPAIDFQVGFDVAEPFDGTNQFPDGHWQVDSINFDLNAPPFPTDGLRRIFVTAEDVAGNINPELAQNVQELEIFIDTQGPQITDVTVNAPSGTAEGDDYDLFDPKPSTDGPTPLVNSIFIEIQDLPNRVVPGFDQPAFKPDIADNPGHYLVTGDYNGIIPILDVNVILDPAVNGQPATGRVQLIFRLAGDPSIPVGSPGNDGVFNTSDDIGAALPDDRFTLFVNDEGIIDFAGNIGDFESNADEPHNSPPGPGEPDVLGVDGVPTGDGLPGGDFLARFTVDTRPELGVWAAGSAFLDLNGNTIWDPDNEDFTNRDVTHTMGFVSDDLFSGRFATNGGEGGLFDDGFDKLGAYGRVGTSTFRWLIDTDNDGVADIEQPDPSNVNGLPVAGNFALGSAGDEVGLFTGTTWHFDTNHNFQVDTSIAWPVAGSAIVGDFDGDGRDDLGTWTNDTFSFDLSSIGPAGPVAALNNPALGTGVNGTIDRTFRFGFAGPGERPVAADMNQDGIEDVGLWMPARDGITPRGQAEWYFLLSGVTQNDTGAAPANLGPTITGSNDPTPGAYLANSALYGLTNYTTGRIVIDPLFPNANVVRFQPVPFGNDQSMNFGDDFALPLVGNFDPPSTPTPGNPPGDPPVDPTRDVYDVNDDGDVDTIDLLVVLNYLTTNGIGDAPSGGFTGAPYVDVNADLVVNTTDLLVLLNYLTLNPPVGPSGAAAEGEGGSANDDYFTRLGSGGGAGDDDDLIDVLAGG